MKDEEIIKGNKLIAEFMGGRNFDDNGHYETYVGVCEDTDTGWVSNYLQYTRFHNSWDWIIPVSNLIINLAPIIDDKGSAWTWVNKTGLIKRALLQAVKENDVYILFTSIVEFIKWYNNHRK